MKTKLLAGAALGGFAAIAAFASTASAQNLPPAVVAVVDSSRIYQQCTACVAAQAQLQAQLTAAQTRAQQLSAPLQTEQTALQTAIQALRGAQPDAALQTRIRAFETSNEAAQRELAERQQTLQRNAQFVRQQIDQRLGPIVQQQMAARGANLAIDRGQTFAAATTIEITDAVLAALNTALPSVSVTAPPPPPPAAGAPGATPRPATPPTTPRPTGR